MLNILSVKLKTVRTWFAVILLGFMVLNAYSGELVYTPTNPTFGGNPNNASGLMTVANAQNNHKAPVPYKELKATAPVVTALDKFTASVQAGILARLKNDAVDSLYPEDGVPTLNKEVDVGNFTVTLKLGETDNTLIMVTTDKTSKQSTEIIVGNYNPSEDPAP